MVTRATLPFATRIPRDLAQALDAACDTLGLKKTYVVERALREWIEDSLDARDLHEAVRSATGFHAWTSVKRAAEGSAEYMVTRPPKGRS
ncbi:MAG: hypothetical protein HY608_04885 [Planctomycetes bacterium]|nr:hypothetical protein [Planctomycetota bacterium]